jgi:antitoxin component of RelBE/YafQ-DinJ toxin-antitoxin module
MNAKLTLTIEQSVIEKAKIYAKSKGRSLSDVIESYLKIVAKEEEISVENITPTVKLLQGTFKAPQNFDYKSELTKKLSSKYLR